MAPVAAVVCVQCTPLVHWLPYNVVTRAVQSNASTRVLDYELESKSNFYYSSSLACLMPSSFLRVGDHGHSHRRSPLIPVSGHSYTLRQWPPRPVLYVVQPASSWMTSVSLAVDSSLEYMTPVEGASKPRGITTIVTTALKGRGNRGVRGVMGSNDPLLEINLHGVKHSIFRAHQQCL